MQELFAELTEHKQGTLALVARALETVRSPSACSSPSEPSTPSTSHAEQWSAWGHRKIWGLLTAGRVAASQASVRRALGRRGLLQLSGLVVVPDGGGQGQDALQDPDRDPTRSAAAVALQVELALEGVVDRLDQLPQRLEQVRSGPLGFALAGWPQQPHAQLGQERLELAAVVVLVGQQRLSGSGGHHLRLDRQQVHQHLALVGLGAGKREGDREAMQGADKVQPQPPRSSVSGWRSSRIGPTRTAPSA
jgi:hypothetical protein